ncbi:MAG: hypothetical protein NVSMB51_01260 [Solirubrobacteraceae bacterium]
MMKRSASLVALVALSLGSVPAVAAGGGKLAGRTGDGRPVVLSVKGNKASFGFKSRFRCSNGTGFVARAGYRGLKLRNGRFNVKLANRNRSIRTTLTGTIRGKRASGTIYRRASVNSSRKLDPKGTLICTSTTTWKASKR